jgi:hypothetical protein
MKKPLKEVIDISERHFNSPFQVSPASFDNKEATVGCINGGQIDCYAFGDIDRREEVNATLSLIAHMRNTYAELVEALEDVFEDWKTLVGEDLRDENEDVLKIWSKAEAALDKANTVRLFEEKA